MHGHLRPPTVSLLYLIAVHFIILNGSELRSKGKHGLLRPPGMCSCVSLSPGEMRITHSYRSSPRASGGTSLTSTSVAGTATTNDRGLSVSATEGIKSTTQSRGALAAMTLSSTNTAVDLLGLLVEILHQVLNLVELDDHHLDGCIS